MNIAYFHPQIVHFVIALLFVGVIARVLSLLPLPSMLKFISPAAATLIILGSLATIAAVKSGDDAHGPAERVPGARPIVVEHEEQGEKARNIFLVVMGIEIIGLALYRKMAAAKAARAVSAVVGVVGLFQLYHAAEHGGEVVYSYAGGIGVRSGDTLDLQRTLIAALYHNAIHHRAAGRHEEAARLMNEMVRLNPADPEMQLTGAESVIRDQRNPATARAILENIQVPEGNARLERRKASLIALADSLAQAPRDSAAGAPR